ncbi:MAG: efflux RND transporter periplasmic adaptor subunit [Methylocystis sp.]|uniref:efflux RND transporter periplasmic adaptor subunit n=1 Tax=Methylocystis sp. TaxID=1911079 RepID=UPI003DA35C5D
MKIEDDPTAPGGGEGLASGPPRAGPGNISRFVFAATVAAGLAAFGIISRRLEHERLVQWTDAQSTTSVELATLRAGSGDAGLTLPGEIKALNEAQIRARVNGYIREWKHDIGARVKAGETLATIDAPELDQQYQEAKGQLEKAEAHAQLARLTSKRWTALRSSTVVSQQSVDEKSGEANAKDAEVAVARGNLNRLQALKGFTEVTAPFAGVVTARRIDVGVLVGPSNPVEMFDVADIHQLRVYVRVPQSLAPQIRQGMKATLSLPQYPGRTFDAKVIATSDAIEANSRTLLVQLLANNDSGALLPGSFAEVRFEIPKSPNVIRIPATALMFRANQIQIAVVGPDQKVSFRKLAIDRDLGSEVEVSAGVRLSDRIVNFPPETLQEGEAVIVPSEGSSHRPAGQPRHGDGKE